MKGTNDVRETIDDLRTRVAELQSGLDRMMQDNSELTVQRNDWHKLADLRAAEIARLQNTIASLESDCEFANCKMSEYAERIAELEAVRDSAINELGRIGFNWGESVAKEDQLSKRIQELESDCAEWEESFMRCKAALAAKEVDGGKDNV